MNEGEPTEGKMKVLSLWQPWASAVAVGAKRVETRSWRTTYRGLIAIHAAKRRVIGELIYFRSCWNWCGALASLGVTMGNGPTLDHLLPFGAVVAVADLVDCLPTDSFTVGLLDRKHGQEPYQWTERQMGDFSPGRYGWVFENIRALAKPLPMCGHQGLWTPTSNEVAGIQKRLSGEPPRGGV